jgi:isoquinoline 1-oxidoreductase alpha subunit
MPKQTFILNGKPVTVDVHDDVRVLWVLRDLLGVHGLKYGCGINVCKACTSHINGRAFNPCSVRVGDLEKDDHVTTIEGLPREAKHKKNGLHPMQQAWLDHDVAQCGYCQPGQIMAAVALVNKVRREKRKIKDKDLDAIRNICRCGSYTRIREAIEQGARHM